MPWLSSSRLKAAIAVLLALGILFRFAHLEQKPYWFDEASTSLQLSGYSRAEVTAQVVNGQVHGIRAFDRYQYPSPAKTVGNTVAELAAKEPQLTPLYFVMARYWVQWFGNSVAATRSLSAVLSLLMFPAVYWLCLELFQSRFIGWVSIALFAVSPFQILYAQEARPPMLWAVLVLIGSAMFLKAIRQSTFTNWALYALTVSAGLYSFPLTAFVTATHGAYLLLVDRLRLTRRLFAYLGAASLGGAAFLPWVVLALVNFQQRNKERFQSATSIATLVKGWVRGLSLFFIDFNLNENSQPLYWYSFLAATLALTVLTLYAVYYLWRTAPLPSWLFVVLSITLPALAMIVPDLVLGGDQSTRTRYLIPTYLFLQIAIAYLFGSQLSRIAIPSRQRQLWQVGLAVLLSIGVLSGVSYTQSKYWWVKATGNAKYQLAEVINQAEKPLLVSDNFFVMTLAIAHALEDKVQVQLVEPPAVPSIPDGFSDVYLFFPTPNLETELAKIYEFERIDGADAAGADQPYLLRLTRQD